MFGNNSYLLDQMPHISQNNIFFKDANFNKNGRLDRARADIKNLNRAADESIIDSICKKHQLNNKESKIIFMEVY